MPACGQTKNIIRTVTNPTITTPVFQQMYVTRMELQIQEEAIYKKQI
jgi:hypothetical protein